MNFRFVWPDRAIRRCLVVTVAVVVLAFAACASAWASEPPPAPDGTLPPAPNVAGQEPEVAAPAPVAPPPVVDWHRRRRSSEETSWYGWQTLIADGASLVVLPIVGGVAESEEILGLSLGGYLLAAPIIHAAHGRWGMTFASLGLRLVLPTGGLVVGSAVDQEGGRDYLAVGAVVGFILGVGAAVTLDATLLSYETVDEDERARDRDAAARAKQRGFFFAPSLAPRKEGGFDVGLAATF